MDSLWQDLRYAARQLLKSPGFTFVSVVTLALGIGANSAIFSVVNGVLLRPLPFPDPDRLVEVGHLHNERGAVFGAFSPQDFDDLQRDNRVFEHLATYWFTAGQSGSNLTGSGEPVRVGTALVSGDFFAALGMAAARGRALRPADDVVGGDNHVAVLSDRLWRQRFGGDASIVGRTVTLDGKLFTVTGVMPPAFEYPSRDVDLWLPVSIFTDDDVPHRREVRWLNAVGRLRPGVSLEAGQAAASAIISRLAQEYPESNKGWVGAVLEPMHDALVGGVRPALLVLLGSVAMVLLIACANVANLVLARATSRGREVAIRAALGARRGRLIRQMLTESLLLSLTGGAVGLLIGIWGLDSLLAISGGRIPQSNMIHLDPTVISFTFLLSVITGLLFAIVPAFRSTRDTVLPALSDGGRTGTAGRQRQTFRSALVVSQLALAVVLLAGAGLMVRSFWRLTHVNPGFEPDQVLTLRISIPETKYPYPGKDAAYRNELIDKVAALPGVVAVGGSKTAPLRGGGEPYEFSAVGKDGAPRILHARSGAYIVTPGYFRALGIPIVRGRDFSRQDNPDAFYLLVNEAAAREFWPNENAIGQTLLQGERRAEVIGVVGDVRNDGLATDAASAIYVPITRFSRSTLNMFVRTAGNPLLMAGVVRDAIWAVDRDQPISDLGPLREAVSGSISQPRFTTTLLALFGSLAAVLAALGIYGVMSYTVSQRAHEIGIRMALGARAADVLMMVVGRALTLTGIGIGIGLLGAAALTRLLASLLFGTSATDPLTFAAITLILAGVALVASYVPARRAARVDPVVVLRNE
ncbi:MAG: ABC transporter permease [Gemmatimonadota bacterium]